MKSYIKTIYSQWNWDGLDDLADWVVEEAIRIQQIPAPTFDEKARARLSYQQCSNNMKLADVSIDDVYNVYGRLPGKTSESRNSNTRTHRYCIPRIDTDLTIKRDGNVISGPGLR